MIYYDFVSGSIVGDVLIAASEKGLCAVMFGRRTKKGFVKQLMKKFPKEGVQRRPHFMKPYREELKDYNFLSTFKVPYEEVGFTAMELLNRRMKNPDAPILNCQVCEQWIRRYSVGVTPT